MLLPDAPVGTISVRRVSAILICTARRAGHISSRLVATPKMINRKSENHYVNALIRNNVV